MAMPDSRTPRRTPTALAAGFAAVLAVAAGGGSFAHAQSSDWMQVGALSTSDPTFNRPYLFQGVCYLSSVGTDVRFDVYEFRLDDAVAPADLLGSLCSGAAFDSVLYLYQRPAGEPGAFWELDPCARLILYSDDYCGSASLVWGNSLVLGDVTLVVTSFANGQVGDYTLTADSAGSHLQDFIFYSGFETGNARTWSLSISF
jgi:hypothetical protein